MQTEDNESEIEDAIEVVDDEDEDDDENLEEILYKNSKTSSEVSSTVESEIVTAPSGEKFEFTFYGTNDNGEKPQNHDGNEFEIECVESMEEAESADCPNIPDISVKQETNNATVKLSDDDVMPNLDSMLDRCFCHGRGCVHFNASQRTYKCPRCSERLGSLSDYIRNGINFWHSNKWTEYESYTT